MTYQDQYNKAIDYYNRGRDDKAIQIFENIRSFYQGTPKIDTIMFYTANSYYNNRNYFMSSDLYNEYRTSMGRGVFYAEANLYYALSLYRISPDPKLDQSYTTQAIAAFEDFLYHFPDHELEQECLKYLEELRARVYESELSIAQTYYDIRQYKSAIITLRNILKNNPNTPFRENVLFMIVQANYEYARSSIPDKRRERFFDTIDAYYNFASEYPQSELIKRANRLHLHAQSITEGTAVVNEVTGNVKLRSANIYSRRDKVITKLNKAEDRGASEKKIKRLQDELDIANKAIEALESLVEQRKRDTEIRRGQ